MKDNAIDVAEGPKAPKRSHYCPHCDVLEGLMHGRHCRDAGTFVQAPKRSLSPDGSPDRGPCGCRDFPNCDCVIFDRVRRREIIAEIRELESLRLEGQTVNETIYHRINELLDELDKE